MVILNLEEKNYGGVILKWLVIGLMSLFVLVGCSHEEKDLSSYPESVQDGEISVKFYDDLSIFVEDYDTVYYGMMHIAETEEKYPDSILLKQYVDAIKTMDDSFKDNINNVKLKPKTEKDKQLNQIVKNIIVLQKDYNEAMWEKAENVMPDNQTMLSIDRSMLSNLYKQLKEEIE